MEDIHIHEGEDSVFIQTSSTDTRNGGRPIDFEVVTDKPLVVKFKANAMNGREPVAIHVQGQNDDAISLGWQTPPAGAALRRLPRREPILFSSNNAHTFTFHKIIVGHGETMLIWVEYSDGLMTFYVRRAT